MFDSVGQPPLRQRRRQAGALLLSLLLNGGAATALVIAGSSVAVDDPEVMEPIEIFPEFVSPPPLPPPPLGTGKRTAKSTRTAGPVVPEAAPVPVSDVPPLVVDAAPAPPPGGDGTGDADAPGGGDPEGVPGGELGAPPPKAVHWTEVKVKTRPTARPEDYPEAARALNLPATRCIVRVHIDERGVPYEVTPRACPAVFFESARTVAMRFRAYPVKEDGRAVRAAFDLALTFEPSR